MQKHTDNKIHTSWNLKVELRKGVIIHTPLAHVGGKKCKAKFFVIMENPLIKQNSLLVCMTTSIGQNTKSWEFRHIETPILKKGYTWLIYKECHDVPVVVLKKQSVVGILSDEEIKKIDYDMKYCRAIPNKWKKRILRKPIHTKVRKSLFKISETEGFKKLIKETESLK